MKRMVGAFAVSMILVGSWATAEVDWRFAPGLTFMSGFSKVVDFYEEQYGADATGGEVPVGLSFNATLQISHGEVVASGPSLGVGPVAMVLGDLSYYDVPFVLTYGIKFVPNAAVGPYLRAGVAYHFASGDNVKDSTPGLFVGLGLDILQTKRVGIGFEVAYDSSQVTFEGEETVVTYRTSSYGYRYPEYSSKEVDKDIRTGGVVVSIRAVF